MFKDSNTEFSRSNINKDHLKKIEMNKKDISSFIKSFGSLFFCNQIIFLLKILRESQSNFNLIITFCLFV